MSLARSFLRDSLREAAQALALIGLFAAACLGAHAVLAHAALGPAAPGAGGHPDPSRAHDAWTAEARPLYPVRPMEDEGRHPARWLVDGFNVLNVGVLHGERRKSFWTEPARGELLELARGLGESVVVVFDGPRPAAGEAEPGAPEVVFAESADDWLLREVRVAPDPSALVVVTADRKLAARARHRGARVVPPSDFVQRCRTAG